MLLLMLLLVLLLLLLLRHYGSFSLAVCFHAERGETN
jgi:hypothetical protein